MKKTNYLTAFVLAGSLLAAGSARADSLGDFKKRTNKAIRKEAEGEVKEKTDKAIDKTTGGKSNLSKSINKELKTETDAVIDKTGDKAESTANGEPEKPAKKEARPTKRAAKGVKTDKAEAPKKD